MRRSINPPTFLPTGRRNNRGASITEVLVSLVVVSTGILGNVAMYVTTTQVQTNALLRMQAIDLCNEMAERIRANRAAESAYVIASSTPAVIPARDCDNHAITSQRCTPSDMAANDLYQWDGLVSKTFPHVAVRSIIVDTSTSPTTYTINISWHAQKKNVAQSYSIRLQI